MTALAGLPANLGVLSAPSRLLRVLYAANLDPSKKCGSFEEQTFLLASAFQQRGGLLLPVFTRTPESIARGLYQAANLEFSALDFSRFHLGTLRRLLHLTARHNIEVVHWNFYPALTNGYVWALSVLAPRLKHYLTDHISRPANGPGAVQRYKRIKRLFLRRYARVVGVSRYVVDCLHHLEVGLVPTCCPYFINTDRFAPNAEARSEVRRRLGAGDRFVLVAPAALIKEKGIDVALRAVARLGDVLLWVLGDGPEASNLAALAEELGLHQRVSFLGLQSQVEPYMQAADAFVCPSLWGEAAGLVNIEAQSCGLPVLASRIGGIPEYVQDGQTGFLFPPGDDESLAAAARRLQDDPQRRRDMGRNAREWAVGRFSLTARLDDYLELYRP
jgi:glycosyltransferase involved in cell wall biosynthesis